MRYELYEGPDELGRYHYAAFWMADYHPGDPRGEHRIAERGQHFFAVPSKTMTADNTTDMRIRK